MNIENEIRAKVSARVEAEDLPYPRRELIAALAERVAEYPELAAVIAAEQAAEQAAEAEAAAEKARVAALRPEAAAIAKRYNEANRFSFPGVRGRDLRESVVLRALAAGESESGIVAKHIGACKAMQAHERTVDASPYGSSGGSGYGRHE